MVSTPQISGLATRLAAPARLLATRLQRRGRGRAEADLPEADRKAPADATPLPLDGRLHAALRARSPESEAWEFTIRTYAAMAREERWSQLLADLRSADQARTAAPGGRRLAELISAGARADLTAALAARTWDAAMAEVERLEAALAPHAESYVAAHLVAQARIDLGWARRSAEPGPGVPRDVWQFFLHQTALAEAALEGFDPIEEMSPVLAGTRYLLVRGIEDGDTLFRDWYEDWSDLDLTNPDAHMAHAVLLLPHWFGSAATFDDEARAAMKRTEHGSGAAAYAAFYMAVSDHLGALPQKMDLPLFLAGLMDYYRATGCQYRANIVAAAMTELLHSYTQDAPGSSRTKLVLNTLTEHLSENLREFHLSAWENGENCVRFALEQVFARQLARGEHIYVGPEGLISHLPT